MVSQTQKRAWQERKAGSFHKVTLKQQEQQCYMRIKQLLQKVSSIKPVLQGVISTQQYTFIHTQPH